MLRAFSTCNVAIILLMTPVLADKRSEDLPECAHKNKVYVQVLVHCRHGLYIISTVTIRQVFADGLPGSTGTTSLATKGHLAPSAGPSSREHVPQVYESITCRYNASGTKHFLVVGYFTKG